METNVIKPIAMPGIHERFYPFFKEILPSSDSAAILDVGAGHGAFCKKLHEEGYNIYPCDLFPEIFYYKKLECKKADITKSLPYGNGLFELVLAIEVMEHIPDHEVFFKECNRVLKDKGKIIISTPNILSLKSRIRFLFSGFFYSFKPLDLHNNDGLQHVASLTVDQYNYIGIRNGFKLVNLKVDKNQTTSKILMFLKPLVWLYCKLKKIKYQVHNTYELLTGRVLFLVFEKTRNVPAEGIV